MKTRETKRLVIVGGGAAGLAAAIAAGQCARSCGRPLQIDLFERDDRVGRSILVTGNGRCNFSNSRLELGRYRNAEFVGKAREALHASGLSARSAVAFLESCGLAWREEPDGRMYPLANKASTVVDVLRASAAAVGVRECCEQDVRTIEAPRAEGKRFTLRMADGVLERADALVLACGGRALRSIDIDGLSPERQRPMLGPLRVADGDIPFVRELDNIRVKASVELERGAGAPVARESGELMFRKYGVSGICVFNLSRFAEPGDDLVVNLLQEEGPRAAELMRERRSLLTRRFGRHLDCEGFLRGLILPRIADALLKRGGLDAGAFCDDAALDRIVSLLTRCTLEVAGIGDADICQVMRGGFAVGQFDPATMQAHDVPGLFVAGEALDVDGPCGGYNLDWAWTSGLLAGWAAANAEGSAR